VAKIPDFSFDTISNSDTETCDFVLGNG